MLDRLAELRRQRALVAEHLAWLDRELATAAQPETLSQASTDAPSPATASALAAVPNVPPSVSPSTPNSTVAAAAPESVPLPALPETKPAEIKNDVRRGCLLYLAIASAVALAAIALLIWASRSAWVKQEAGPYIAKAAILALILTVVATVRGYILNRRTK